jgi:hypothetical protein
MKNIKLFFVMLMASFIFGCESDTVLEYHNVNLEMKLIDGSWTSGTYRLPKNADLYVRTYRGSYELCYKVDDCSGRGCRGEVKAAVIDFKIIE